MPNIKTIRAAVAELSNGPPLVVVLAGGTAGIGSYIAHSLAKCFSAAGSKLRVYIVGRNAVRAKDVIARGKSLSPGSDWRFIQATDLALISEVDRSCAEIIRQETEAPLHDKPSIDLLYMSHGHPVLKKQTAHIVSIYAGGFEDGTSPGELPIGCPPPATYGVTGVRKHTCFMKNFMFEEFAEKHAGKLSLIHIYPGLVDGPAFSSPELPRWFRVLWRLLKPFLSIGMTSADDCGAVMLYLATSRYPAKGAIKRAEGKSDGVPEVALGTTGELGGGAYAVGQRGDVGTKGKSYKKVRQEGMSKQVWDHTMEVLTQVEKKNAVAS